MGSPTWTPDARIATIPAGQLRPDSYQLVRTVGAGDVRERVAEVGGEWVFGGE
jgi:hypothetical protein